MNGNEMQELISVIVPVYNVGAYLRECLESITGQTYEQLEIIAVDDGSTDDSGAICNEYAEKDDRFQVVHKANGGAAAARNIGLDLATGTYLAFVDGDDFIERDAFEHMISAMSRCKADVAQFGFRSVYTDGNEENIAFTDEKLFKTQEYLKRFTEDWKCGLLWDKLYKRELFAGIRFEEGHVIDDEYFTYKGIMNAKTIAYVPIVTYNYRQRLSGVMKTAAMSERIVLDKLDYLNDRRKKIGERFPELKVAFDTHYIDRIISLSKESASTEKSVGVCKKLLKEYLHEKNKANLGFPLLVEATKLLILPTKSIMKQSVVPETKDNVQRYFR